jgi:hypothetical protein
MSESSLCQVSQELLELKYQDWKLQGENAVNSDMVHSALLLQIGLSNIFDVAGLDYMTNNRLILVDNQTECHQCVTTGMPEANHRDGNRAI